MAGSVLEFTDANWKSEVLEFAHSRAGRLLGPLVRPVPDAGADDREAGRRIQGQGQDRQDEYRREPGDAGQACGSRPSRPSWSSRTARKSIGWSASTPSRSSRPSLTKLGVS